MNIVSLMGKLEEYTTNALMEMSTAKEEQVDLGREFRTSSLPFCPILSFLREKREESYSMSHYTSIGTAMHLTAQTWLAKTKISSKWMYGNWTCTGCGKRQLMSKKPKPCSCSSIQSRNVHEIHRRMQPFWMYDEIDYNYRGLTGHIDLVLWPEPEFAFVVDFKCVVGSTLVNTQDGFVSMDELGFRQGSHPYSNKIVGPKGLQDVVQSYKSKAETYKLSTFNGFELEGTPIHPVCVITPNLDMKWKQLKDIKVGDWVVTSTSKSKPVWAKKEAVGKSLAKIMGWLTANGSWNGYFHHFSTSDTRLAKKVEKYIRKVTGKGWHAVYDKNSSVPNYVAPKSLNTILDNVGYSYRDMAKGKEIPYAVRTSSKEIMDAYLNAYFECDSGYGKGCVLISSASEKFIHQLHVILWQGYNILGRRYVSITSAGNSSTPTEREYFYIDIRRRDILTFLSEFPKSKVVKNYSFQLKKKAVIRGNSNHDRRQIPYIAQHYWNYYTSRKRGANKIQFPDGSIRRDAGVKYFTNENKLHVAEIELREKEAFDSNVLRAEFYPEFQSKIDSLLNKGYTFDEVLSIEETKTIKTVYDVTVPKGHAFMSNGIISHNTSDLTSKRKTPWWNPSKPSSPTYVVQTRTYNTVLDLQYDIPIKGWVLANLDRAKPIVKAKDFHLILSPWSRSKSLKWDRKLELASKNNRRLVKLEQAIESSNKKEANKWLDSIIEHRPCFDDSSYNTWMKYAFFQGECALKKSCLSCKSNRIKDSVYRILNERE